MNLLYLASFPLVGIAGFLALRRLGADPWPAVVCAVLYALLPYHFLRGEGHLWLVHVLRGPGRGLPGGSGALRGTAAPGRRDRPRDPRRRGFRVVLLRRVHGRARRARGGAALLGNARSGRPRRRRRWLSRRSSRSRSCSSRPRWSTASRNGTNEEVAQRYTFESEVYSLKLTQLVLPLDAHRIDAVARLEERLHETSSRRSTRTRPRWESSVPPVCVWLLAVVLGALVGRRAPRRHLGARDPHARRVPPRDHGRGRDAARGRLRADPRLEQALDLHRVLRARCRRARADALGRGVLAAGGVRGRPGRRARGRGLRPDEPGVRARRTARSRDSGTSTPRSSRRSIGAPGRSDGRAAARTRPSPSHPPARQAIYEPVKRYLHTHDLHWSYGAMRGRDDWAAANADQADGRARARSPEQAGFAAILVDRLGYAGRRHGGRGRATNGARGRARAQPQRALPLLEALTASNRLLLARTRSRPVGERR